MRSSLRHDLAKLAVFEAHHDAHVHAPLRQFGARGVDIIDDALQTIYARGSCSEVDAARASTRRELHHSAGRTDLKIEIHAESDLFFIEDLGCIDVVDADGYDFEAPLHTRTLSAHRGSRDMRATLLAVRISPLRRSAKSQAPGRFEAAVFVVRSGCRLFTVLLFARQGCVCGVVSGSAGDDNAGQESNWSHRVSA